MISTEELVASSASPTAPVSPNGDFTLSNIIRVLRPLEDKYDSLGTHLGVKLEDLKRIEGDYSKNARRFTETIEFWQNNSRNPSWSVLANAVEKVGGHSRLVLKLRASESLKSEDVGYLSAGSDSPSRYSSGSDTEYYDKVSGCSCEKPCSVYTISSGRCPRPTTTEVGIVRKRIENQAARDALLPDEMVDSEEEDYTEGFEKETKQMRVQFAGLVDDVSDSFKKRNVTTDRAVLFLQNAHPLLKTRIDEMTKASNMDQVLTIVTDQACSWFDYEIIKDLVGKVGDGRDRKLLSEYEAKFKKFVEQRKLPKGKKHIEIGSGARKGGKQLVIKIDKEWEEINFNDLDKIRGNLAFILNVKRRDLYLANIREGCVMMTFMITEEMAETLFPKDLTSSYISSQLKLLQNEGIILLTCGKVSWRPAMDQSLSEPQEKSLVYSKPLDSHPDSLLDRQKLESRSPILGSSKEVMGNGAVQPPGCVTFTERVKWTEAFGIPIQLPPAFMSSRTPIKDYFSVNLIKNCSAVEIGHSGQYCLSISTSAIILHWRTMAIAHQWSRRNVIKFYRAQREGHLILNIRRTAGGPPMEFEFVTDTDSVMQILKLWNVRVLESIPPSQPEFKTTPTISTKHSSKERRSFRTPKAAPLVPDNDLKRAGSFSKMHTLGIGQLAGAALPGRRSWGGSNEIYPPPVPPSGSQLSQDSVFNSLIAPPPLPPRPEESDSDDPDYKVKGPESQRGRSRAMSSGVSGAGGRGSSPTLDDQLEELKKSIMRENKKKKRDKVANQGGRKAATLHFPPRSSPRSRLPMNFARAEPEDYLEPVASKRLTSTNSEGVPRRDKLSPNIDNLPQSLSDHSGNANNSSSSSIGTAPGEVFDDSQSPPDVHAPHIGNISSSISSGGAVGGVVRPGGNPPALPPRPWRNGSVTSVSSVSSATSPSNSSVPPFTNPSPSARGPSISEENSIIEEERCSPILSSPKESRQANIADQSAVATMEGNGSKDGSSSPIDVGSSSVSPAPPLPPRSPTRDRDRLSRKSSSSSVSSNASSSHRCPRCRSLKKTKPLVGKTASLDPRGGGGVHGAVQNLTKEENRKSLPDLNNTSPFPENNLALNGQHHDHSVSREHNHGHSCSKCSVGSSTDGFTGGAATSNGSLPASSSSQNFEYLQLLSEEGERRPQVQQQADIDTDVSPALDLLSSCLQDLEYLENKVNQQNSNNSPPNSGSPNQLKNSSKSAAAIANEQRRMAVQIDINAAMRQVELVQADLSITRRNIRPVNSIGPEETRKMVANGHPPLLKKHNTIASFGGGSHSSSKSPSPPTTSSGSGNAPLHWTQQPLPQQPAGRPGNLTNGSMICNSSSSSLVSTPTNVASPRSIQSPTPVFSPVMSNAPPLPMGGVMGGAPPVPPRSLVSLGGEAQQLLHAARVQQPPPHYYHPSMKGRSFSQTNTSTRPRPEPRGLSKSNCNSLGRNMGTWKTAIYGDPHHVQMQTHLV